MATEHFQQKHDYNIENRFSCRSEHVRRVDARGGKKTYEQAHTHTQRGTTTVTTNTYNIIILYLCKTAHH